jgi:hypothetical protein
VGGSSQNHLNSAIGGGLLKWLQVIAGEVRLFNDDRRTRERQIQHLEERVGQLKQEDTGVTSQRSAKERELALIRKELDVVQDLQRRNSMPMRRVYSRQRDETRRSGEGRQLYNPSITVRGIDAVAVSRRLRRLRHLLVIRRAMRCVANEQASRNSPRQIFSHARIIRLGCFNLAQRHTHQYYCWSDLNSHLELH